MLQAYTEKKNTVRTGHDESCKILSTWAILRRDDKDLEVSKKKTLNGLPQSLLVHIIYHMEGKVRVFYVLNLPKYNAHLSLAFLTKMHLRENH